MNQRWQVPISAVKGVAHYFGMSPQTGLLLRARCGRFFNPGFALVVLDASVAAGRAPVCLSCARQLRKEAARA